MVSDGAILNFDISSQVMIKPGSMAQIAAKIAGLGTNVQGLAGLTRQEEVQLARDLRGIEVTVTGGDGLKFRSKIKQFGPENANTHTFTVENQDKPPKTMTIKKYFKTHHGRDLRHPQLPVVRLSARAWYPLEYCTVEPGQKYTKKLKPEQLAVAIQWLSPKPAARTEILSGGIANHLTNSKT